MAFKLKGWSGYQKPSPVNKLDLSNTLSKIQSTISNIVGGIKIKPNTGDGIIRQTIGTGPGQITESEYIDKYGKLPGLGLTLEEKKLAKRLGISEWNWKTGTNLTHHQKSARKKYMKGNLDLDNYENNQTTTTTTTTSDNDNDYDYDDYDYSDDNGSDNGDDNMATYDYGEGYTTKSWKQEGTGTHPVTGEPFTLNTLAKYRDEVIVPGYGRDSQEYINIQNVINEAYRNK